ncbi:MAG: glycosyltransferase family 2 protein [Ardenticatenaceae bacterium]
MRSDPFFVSVIIPVYNGEAFLAEAALSVLRQHYEPLELIIVDDGSTDRTAEVAANLAGDVRYVYQPNRGAPAARNKGLKMARGNVIAFLDADDLWHENKLRLQLARLASHPLAELIVGYSQLLVPTASEPNFSNLSKFERFGEPWLFLNLASAVFRTSVFEKVGLFDQELSQTDDLDWFMRARESKISMIVHHEVVLFHRRHKHNITNQREVNHLDHLKMLKKSLDRRRKRGHGVVPEEHDMTALPKFSDYAEKAA